MPMTMCSWVATILRGARAGGSSKRACAKEMSASPLLKNAVNPAMNIDACGKRPRPDEVRIAGSRSEMMTEYLRTWKRWRKGTNIRVVENNDDAVCCYTTANLVRANY